MYICFCKQIPRHQLDELAQQGCESVQAIQAACGAGTDCGSCRERLEEFLNQKERHNSSPSAEEESA